MNANGLYRFSAAHQFAKPNDVRALNLMNHAARSVMHELDDIVLAFGESDEYSFLFRRSTDLYQRRESKIVSTVVSLFTSAYVYYWNDYFTDSRRPLYPPVFDGRAVLYPSEVEVKDYFAWRQADTHINNLFNTSFWALVEKGGMTPKAAEVRLSVRIFASRHDSWSTYRKEFIYCYTSGRNLTRHFHDVGHGLQGQERNAVHGIQHKL